MFSNEDYTPEEFIEIAFAHLNLDKSIVEKHLIPRWEQYFPTLHSKLFKNEPRTELDKIEADVLFKFIIGEAAIRSAILHAKKSIVDSSEAVDALQPYYRDVKQLLKLCQNNSLKFSPDMGRIYLEEKKKYENILKELVFYIRNEGNGVLLEENHADASPLQQAVANVENEIQNSSQQQELEDFKMTTVLKDKNDSLYFPTEAHTRIIKALTPFVQSESKDILTSLITEGASSQKIVFTGSAAQLGTYFRMVHAKIFLHSITKQKLIDWLVLHFLFWNKVTASYAPVSRSSIKTYISEEGRQTVNPIPFI